MIVELAIPSNFLEGSWYGLRNGPGAFLEQFRVAAIHILHSGMFLHTVCSLNADVQPYEYYRGFQQLGRIIARLRDVDQ